MSNRNDIIFKILLSECLDCSTTEEKTLYYFYQKDISRLLLLELGKKLSFILFGIENEENLSDENLEELEYLKFICQKHLENSKLDGRSLANTVLFPEFVSSNNKKYYEFTSKYIGEKFELRFIGAYKKKLEEDKTFEKKKSILSNIHSILSDFLYVDDRKKQERSINLFLKKLGNIFLNYSYENAINNITDEDGDDGKDIIPTFDFRDKGQINEVIERLYTLVSSENICSSGFHNFDKKFLNGGFEPGRLYIFAGKPGQGKSALLLNFAYNSAMKESHKGAVIYVTLENSVEETVNRLSKIASFEETGRRDSYIEFKRDKQKFKDLLSRHFSEKKFRLKYFHPNTSTSDLLSWLAAVQQREKISIVFVDYLSLLTSTKAYEQKRHELGQITLELKKMSRVFGIPIVTAAQINTAGYDRLPTIKNIDESRQIVQHADFIGLLFDEREVTNINVNLEDECQILLGINIDKNRNGPRGTARFIFDSLTMRFIEYVKVKDTMLISGREDFEEVLGEEEKSNADFLEEITFQNTENTEKFPTNIEDYSIDPFEEN